MGKHFLRSVIGILLLVSCSSKDAATDPANAPNDGDASAEAGSVADAGPGADAGSVAEAGSAADAGPRGSLLTDAQGQPLPLLDAPVDARMGDVDVVGVVRDDATGAAVAGATVRVGSVQATSDATGRFAMKAPRGHAVLDVRAAGRVTQIRQIGLGERDPVLEVRLAARATAIDVGSSGHTFTFAGGALEIPAGAYPTPTTMSATFVTSVSAMTGDAFFRMPDGRGARIISVVEVDTAVQPATSVTLRLPVPADVDAAKLALYTLDEASGTWTDPIRPTTVSSGVAVFAVDHFSDKSLFEEGDNAVAIVTKCVGIRTAQGFFVNNAACQAGQRIQRGGLVRPNGNEVEIQTRNGVRATLGGTEVDHRIRDDDPEAETSIHPECAKPSCTTSVRGSAPPPSSSAKPPRLKFLVRSRAVVMGVRGTVFGFDTHGCPSSDASSERASGEISVSAGTVEIQSRGKARALEQGSRVRLCLGCSSQTQPACCYEFKSQPPCGGSSGGPVTCDGPSSTWMCDDLKRYVCTFNGSCQSPPPEPTVVKPITCQGDVDCPVTVPRCLRTLSSGVPYPGTCMPDEVIPQFGWDQYTIPVDPAAPLLGTGSGSGGGGGG